MVRAQVEGPCVMRVAQGVPKTDEVVQRRIFTAVLPLTQQRHRTLWLASIQRPGLDAIIGIVIELCDESGGYSCCNRSSLTKKNVLSSSDARSIFSTPRSPSNVTL